MSTKIYNAYKWNDTLVDLMAHFSVLRQQYIEWGTKCYVELLEDESPIPPTYKVRQLMMAEIAKGMNTKGNLAASVCVIPDGAFDFYLIFYGTEGNIDISHDSLSDFHYQNQSDQPEDISDEEWDARRDKWEELLGDDFVPSNVSLVYELSTPSTLYKIASHATDIVQATAKEKTRIGVLGENPEIAIPKIFPEKN